MSYLPFSNQRLELAALLERVADGTHSAAEWNGLLVTSYPDHFLDGMRQCAIRLMNGTMPCNPGTEMACNALRSWAMAIRSTCLVSDEQTEKVKEVWVCLTANEATVLDELVRRFSNTGILSIEHAAEQRAMWNLTCLLERDGSRPDWPVLEDAHHALQDGYD